MDRGELREFLTEILVAHPNQPNAYYTTARQNRALDRRYKFEVSQIQLEVQRHHFRRKAEVSWPANQLTLELPDAFNWRAIERIEDQTSVNPGYPLNIASRPGDGHIFWVEKNKLQWGLEGPSEAKTLVFFYLAKAESLVNDDAVPLLVPESYHPLISWSAACELVAPSQRVPQDWYTNRDEYRLDWHKSLSRGTVLDNPSTVVNLDNGFRWVLGPV